MGEKIDASYIDYIKNGGKISFADITKMSLPVKKALIAKVMYDKFWTEKQAKKIIEDDKQIHEDLADTQQDVKRVLVHHNENISNDHKEFLKDVSKMKEIRFKKQAKGKKKEHVETEMERMNRIR